MYLVNTIMYEWTIFLWKENTLIISKCNWDNAFSKYYLLELLHTISVYTYLQPWF